MMGFYMDLHLIQIKRSNKKPKAGDVFVVQPIDGVYYYGKVIYEKTYSIYEMFNDFPLIYIYDHTTNKLCMPQKLDKILIAPLLTNYTPQSRGYFYTIGNIPVTDAEKQLDCGFKAYTILDSKHEYPFYRDIHGERIDYIPKYNAPFGLNSYKGINYEICKALNIED